MEASTVREPEDVIDQTPVNTSEEEEDSSTRAEVHEETNTETPEKTSTDTPKDTSEPPNMEKMLEDMAAIKTALNGGLYFPDQLKKVMSRVGTIQEKLEEANAHIAMLQLTLVLFMTLFLMVVAAVVYLGWRFKFHLTILNYLRGETGVPYKPIRQIDDGGQSDHSNHSDVEPEAPRIVAVDDNCTAHTSVSASPVLKASSPVTVEPEASSPASVEPVISRRLSPVLEAVPEAATKFSARSALWGIGIRS